MSFNHEAVAALPVGANADAALIRALCTRRFAYALAASESATNFVAVDPASGVIPLYLLQNSTLFAYDSTDSTTIHDGVTCLVSSEGKRFKSGVISPPYSVLTRATTAQPSTPSVGDTYLIPTAATGTNWAGKDGQIGIYTAGGWRFAVQPIGRELYVRDEDAKYYRNSAGTWTAGVGSIPLATSSVKITNMLGAKASFIIKVENQTTNAPPGSPVAPVAYIIGPSPTGAWAGNAGKVAMCLTTGTFTIITPDEGDQVYDKTLNNNYLFNGTAWLSSGGAIVGYKRQLTATQVLTVASGGSGFYGFDPATGPNGQVFDTDPATIAYTAKTTGAPLDFTYQAAMAFTSASYYVIGLGRDSEVAAIDWVKVYAGANAEYTNHVVGFQVTAVDTSAHTYTIRFYRRSTGDGATSVSRRFIKIQEIAS